MAIAKSIPSTASNSRSASKSKSNSKSKPASKSDTKTIVKPTEAQLRYAQFHHKRRAQAVKHRIDRLHQTPLEVKVVTIGKIRRETISIPFEGDDGYTSVDTKDTSDIEIKAIRLKRPKISAGRRAYLKDSKRAYRRRRKDIAKNGYRGYFTDEDENENENENENDGDKDIEGYFASDTDDNITDNELYNKLQSSKEEDTTGNLNEVFATLPKQQSRPTRRRTRKKRGKAFRTNNNNNNSSVDDSASYQRFQAACHAMMRNIQTQQTKNALPSIRVPSKRWKRSQAHVEASKAQQNTDFYRYKTSGFVAGRKTSNKNAALLLSYKYYQQNQSTFQMDTGATWLTHLPAKQAKRSKGNNYYFQNMAELPHLIQQATSFDGNENENKNDIGDGADGNESVSTLAMRKPGPQKFHRLVAYVQQQLIEKEKQKAGRNQNQHYLLPVGGIDNDNNDGTGHDDSIQSQKTITQHRTREIAESLELLSPESQSKQNTPSRIQQMADSIEGKGGTPKMKLHSSTPFSELSKFSNYSSVDSYSQLRRKRRRSKYVPRMRLRDFVPDDGTPSQRENNDDNDVPTPLPRKKLSERFKERFVPEDSNDEMVVEGEDCHANTTTSTPTKKPPVSPPRKMKLRDSVLGDQESATKNDNSRTREMAMAFEQDDAIDPQPDSKFQQIRKSLEPDTTPRMQLKGAFDRIDEKKVDDQSSPTQQPNISRSSVERLSKQFAAMGGSPPTEEQLEDFNRPSREVMDEFSKHIDPRILQEFESMGQDPQQYYTNQPSQQPRYSTSSSSYSPGNDHHHSASPATAAVKDDKRQSGASNVTEFFARIRGEQQQQRQHDLQQQQQQQEEDAQGGNNLSGNSMNNVDTVSHPKSPLEHSDAVSDPTKGSNVSNMWSRGRNSINNMTSNLNTIAETKGKGFLSPDVIGKATGRLLSPDVIGKATGGLFNKFRGVPEDCQVEDESVTPTSIQKMTLQELHPTRQSVSNNSQNSLLPHEMDDDAVTPTSIPKMKLKEFHPTQQSASTQKRALQQPQEQEQEQAQEPDISTPQPLVKTNSIDDYDALRNYRNGRASMSPDISDTVSEASSFHALPNQIREVVQNSGGKVSPSAAAAAAAAAAASGSTGVEGHSLGLPPRFVSPNRSSIVSQQESAFSPSELSADNIKRAQERFMENSPMMANEFEHDTIIDTDGASLTSGDHKGMDPSVLARMLMSPDMLQKRLKQAIGSIEQQKWDQIFFLINANPWLAEMKELTTNQFLLHKLAFFGTGTNPAPMSLSEQLIEKFPAAVHKFDQDGNVPLHLAAAAGNVGMIQMLGEKFSSGASIRNEDGMLPLHFAIASFADFESQSDNSRPLETIKTVLRLFPNAIAIADNDGNLPLHVASECLEGGVGVDVVYLLMDEAERQLQDPYGARFRNKIRMEELLDEENSQGDNLSTHIKNMESFMDNDEDLQCTMVVNDFDETPLLAAIRSNKGWEMIEALVSGPGGRKAALKEDSDKNNALHLLVGEFQDATAAMSVLKIVPETAFHRNSENILPIEMACMVMMPEEVILAIALVDLPINIDDKDGLKVFKDRGESWVFLACDCDDHMVHVVEEILSICSFQQLQELCYWKEKNAEQTVLDRATPKCRKAMNRALRFLGRFEFLGDGPLFSDMQTGFKAFDALDFGGHEEGRQVLLECYQNEFDFENRVYTMFDLFLESRFVEEVNVYVEHLEEGDTDEQQQRCVAIERPRLTLKEVVDGMIKNGGYESGKTDKRMKYSAKICSVLKLIAKALKHLHEAGVVHGNVCMETIGKFEDSSWKLLERLGVQSIGKPFDPSRFLHSFPPESLVPLSAENDPQEASGNTAFDSDMSLVEFSNDLVAEVSVDIWAFGKISYEALVGKPLIDFDTKNSDTPSDDVVALLQTCEWNVSNMEAVFADLLQAGIGESGADMITACLFPSPGDRPVDMDEILNNPFWLEIRKYRSPRKSRRSGESASTSVSLFTDVDQYDYASV